jgi:hypothetical protein
MPILKLQPNKQYSLALKYRSAKEANGHYGMQYMYTLSDGQILYLPPVAHQELQSLNLAAGEPFAIQKTVSNGSAAVWSIERSAQPVDDLKPSPKPVATARQITSSAVAVPPSLTTPESIRIFRQLVATIQAVKAAEEFAISIGRPTTFTSEDIRAAAISGFIEQNRRVA